MATTTITKTETLVGKRIRRKEDPRLITGTATYVDDIKLPGMHHACILRRPHQVHRRESGARAPRRRGRIYRRGYRGRRTRPLWRVAARPAHPAALHPGDGSRS